MVVEDAYDGPRLGDDGAVTDEFVEGMLFCMRARPIDNGRRFLMMQAVDGIRKRALEEGTGMMYLSGSTALFVDQGYIERRRQALEHATVLGKIQGRLDEMRRSPAKSKISDLKKFLSEARSELDQPRGAGRRSDAARAG